MTFQRALTPEKEHDLLTDYKYGAPVKELMANYGVSSSTVYRMLAYHEVPRRNKPQEARKGPSEAPTIRLRPCGTNAAYQRHRRAGEYACTSCLSAHALNVKEAKEKQ